MKPCPCHEPLVPGHRCWATEAARMRMLERVAEAARVFGTCNGSCRTCMQAGEPCASRILSAALSALPAGTTEAEEIDTKDPCPVCAAMRVFDSDGRCTVCRSEVYLPTPPPALSTGAAEDEAPSPWTCPYCRIEIPIICREAHLLLSCSGSAEGTPEALPAVEEQTSKGGTTMRATGEKPDLVGRASGMAGNCPDDTHHEGGAEQQGPAVSGSPSGTASAKAAPASGSSPFPTPPAAREDEPRPGGGSRYTYTPPAASEGAPPMDRAWTPREIRRVYGTPAESDEERAWKAVLSHAKCEAVVELMQAVRAEATEAERCRIAVWLEQGAGEKESHWNRVYARSLREHDARIRQRPAKDTTNLHGCTAPVRCGECAACRKAEGR